MKYYNILKYVLNWGSRTKILAVIVAHILRKRYLLLSVDPANGCNYNCRMCYRNATAKEGVKRLSKEEIHNIIRAFGSDTLRLQIGCALEPSIAFDESLLLLQEAKKAKISTVSMCTNGVLLSTQQLKQLAEAGLTELILSCHGIHKESYEYFMRGKFENFLLLIDRISEVKAEYPQMKLRINYTMNAENTAELSDFYQVFGKVRPDILQLRPVQDIGSKDYTNYDLQPIIDMFETVILPLAEECRKAGVQVLMPDIPNILNIVEKGKLESYLDNVFQENSQVYISPDGCYRDDFQLSTDTYRSYSRSHNKIRSLIKALCMSKNKMIKLAEMTTKSMNYQIK